MNHSSCVLVPSRGAVLCHWMEFSGCPVPIRTELQCRPSNANRLTGCASVRESLIAMSPVREVLSPILGPDMMFVALLSSCKQVLWPLRSSCAGRLYHRGQRSVVCALFVCTQQEVVLNYPTNFDEIWYWQWKLNLLGGCSFVGFWRWYMTFRITKFLDLVQRPIFKKLENTTFGILDLFPSSGEGVGDWG
jgi:hypothetical protein